MSDRESFEVRSFRVVFRLERRLHRIDRWRLPAPHGVPLVAAGYAVVVLVAMIAVRQLPVIGVLVRMLPAPLAFALIPAGVAGLVHRWRIDGRPPHRHLAAQAARLLRPPCTTGPRAGARDGHLVAFDRDGVLARGPEHPDPAVVVRGPATVDLLAAARGLAVGPVLVVRLNRRRPHAVARRVRLARGQRMRVTGRAR